MDYKTAFWFLLCHISTLAYSIVICKTVINHNVMRNMVMINERCKRSTVIKNILYVVKSLRNAQKYTSSHKNNRFKIYIIENSVSIFIPLFSAFYRTSLKKRKEKMPKTEKCTGPDLNRGPLDHESSSLTLD